MAHDRHHQTHLSRFKIDAVLHQVLHKLQISLLAVLLEQEVHPFGQVDKHKEARFGFDVWDVVLLQLLLDKSAPLGQAATKLGEVLVSEVLCVR